jgi:hypothetical protein
LLRTLPADLADSLGNRLKAVFKWPDLVRILLQSEREIDALAGNKSKVVQTLANSYTIYIPYTYL